MFDSLIVIAKNEPLGVRIVGFLAGCLVGVLLIGIGRQNIISQQAEESGKRRSINALLGEDNSYTGSTAVLVGWIRVLGGVGFVILGFVFLVFGAFLKP